MLGQPSYPTIFRPIDYAPCYFHIDVTFEMKTVINGIHLFIDNLESSDNIFITDGDGGEESRIAERQRERVSVCERQCVVKKER
jgi:hypothetical protein